MSTYPAKFTHGWAQTIMRRREGKQADLMPRLLARRLSWAVGASPIVVLTGPRGAGKSSLLGTLKALEGWERRNLADLSTREWALRDPIGFVGGPTPLIIEELHRAPQLYSLLRAQVDRRERAPGQFLLTAPVRLRNHLAKPDNFGGRSAFLSLVARTPRELRREEEEPAWSRLFGAKLDRWGSDMEWQRGEAQSWEALARAGGLEGPPETHLATALEVDLPSLVQVERPAEVLRLMKEAARGTGSLLNRAALARSAGVERPTAHRHLDLLEQLYLLHFIPSYIPLGEERPVRSPRVHAVDTGLSLHLTGEAPTVHHLAGLVLNDLLSWRHSETWPPQIHHWATHGGASVSFVLERNGRFLPVSVVTDETPGKREVRHLSNFHSRHPTAVPGALLIHAGREVSQPVAGVWAVPWWRLL